jgi:hypothetical protein
MLNDYELLKKVVEEDKEFAYMFDTEAGATFQAKSLHNTKRKFKNEDIKKIEIFKSFNSAAKNWEVRIKQSKNKVFKIINGEFIPLEGE